MARPKVPLLSRRDVVRSALAIVDAEGMEGLSVRRLAAELNVKGASLYHHFANKDEILVAVGRAVLREIELGPIGDDVIGWLVEGNKQQRRVMLRHPHVISLISRGYLRVNTLPVYQEALRALAALGLPAAARTALLDAVEALTVGDVLVALMPPAPDVDINSYVHEAAAKALTPARERRYEQSVRALVESHLSDARPVKRS